MIYRRHRIDWLFQIMSYAIILTILLSMIIIDYLFVVLPKLPQEFKYLIFLFVLPLLILICLGNIQ